MPHVVFEKKIDLLDFSKKFSPIFQKHPLIKILNVYVDKNHQTALLPTLVIDETQQSYFIEISTTELKTTLRLYPQTDPEKTIGVKTSLALLAKEIANMYNIKITKTNLTDYLNDVVFL